VKDIFLCHASEDKREVVLPLATALNTNEITYWLDEAEVMWGDSLTGKVNEGLRDSRYAIVILSQSFLGKNWPERELNAVLNMEASSGEVRVLPLLVGAKSAIEAIMKRYPLLNDKKYLTWRGDPEVIVHELMNRLRLRGPQHPFRTPKPDKYRFVKEAFEEIRIFFQEALKQLEAHDSRFATEFEEIDKLKFTATIFVGGELKNQCVIWLDSHMGGNQISYREGRNAGLRDDGSMNDWLHVEADDQRLNLRPSGMLFTESRDKFDTAEGATYFWKRFISDL
jgi:hypothetical protein